MSPDISTTRAADQDRTLWRELLPLLLVLLIVITAQLWLARASTVFTRHFWFDEVDTAMLVSDSSLTHAMRALEGGVDASPPTLFLLLRAYTALLGCCNEVVLHSFGFLCLFTTLVGLYASLRRSFSALVALTTTLWFWSHPAIALQAFDARFYGPWLASVIWFNYFFVRTRQPQAGMVVRGCTALCALLVCSIHYLGIVTLVLIVAWEVILRRAQQITWYRGLLAAACGPLALAACLPFLLGQRSAFSVATWVPEPNRQRVFLLLDELAWPQSFAILAIVSWLARLTDSLWKPSVCRKEPGELALQAGLSGLLLLPIVLIAFSYTVQSVLMTRYAVPAVLALSLPVAHLMHRIPTTWLFLLLALFFVEGESAIQKRARAWEAETQDMDRLITAIRTETDNQPVLFDSPFLLLVLCHYAPDLASRCYFLDFERGEIGQDLDSRIIMRDVTRQFCRFYGIPRCKPWVELKNWPRFYLIPIFVHKGAIGGAWEGVYPGFILNRRGREIYELVRQPGH
jgi:hypothetical protein